MFRAPNGSDFNPEIPSQTGGTSGPFTADIQGTYGPESRFQAQTNSFNPLIASDLSVPPIAYDRASYPVGRIDVSTRPVEHLISNGLIATDNSAKQRLEDMASNQRFDGISMVSAAEKDKADFFVDRFGKVTLLNNNLDARGDNTNIVVAVEKPNFQDVLPDDPKQAEAMDRDLKAQHDFAVNAFVQDISNVLVSRKADGTVAISDNNNLVSPELKQQLSTPDATNEVVSTEQMERLEKVNRDFAPNVDGSAREGRMTADQADSYLPQQTIHRGEESNTRRALDTLASMATSGKEHPESHVSTSGNGRVMVGRYGMTHSLFNDWLGLPKGWTDIDNDESMQILLNAILGRPHITKAGEAFVKGLLKGSPKDRQDFRKFMNKLAHGQKPTEAEVKKYLSTDLQKQIASDLVKKYDKATGGKHDIGDIAEMWANDGKKCEPGRSHRALKQEAENLAKLSDARANNKDRKDIHWTSASKDSAGSTNLDLKLVEEAKEVVHERRNNKAGMCLGGVQDALNGVGYGGKRFASAYMMADYVRAHPEKFTIISHDEAEHRKGAMTIFGRSAAHKHGHIAIYAGSGRDLCDKNYKQMTVARAAAKGYGSDNLSFVLNPEYKKAKSQLT